MMMMSRITNNEANAKFNSAKFSTVNNNSTVSMHVTFNTTAEDVDVIFGVQSTNCVKLTMSSVG